MTEDFSFFRSYKSLIPSTHLSSYLKFKGNISLSKRKQKQMAENHKPHLGFDGDSIVAQHAIFALLVDILNNLIQVKYQSMPVSPFDTHKWVMSTFFVALFIYAAASVAEVILRAQKSVYQRLVGNIRLFASAFATILLLVFLALILCCIISVMWTCLFVKLAHESCQELCQFLSQTADLLNMLKRPIAIVRSRREKPNQPNVSVLTSPGAD